MGVGNVSMKFGILTTAEKAFELSTVKILVLQYIAGYICCSYRLVTPRFASEPYFPL